MHKKLVLGLTAALACALVLVGSPIASAERGSGEASGDRFGQDSGLEAIGLTTNQRLVRFEVDNPGQGGSIIGAVSGLAGDVRLVGIDYRVADGLLYGVGNAGGVYTLDDTNAQATKVGQLSIPLMGSTFGSFGVDVNPAADALRIISDQGQNLRFSFSAGTTTADVGLTYPPATTPATGVTGAAYTNNDADANTATTLYDLDTNLDQIAIQAPANSGQLSATGKLTVDAGSSAGFDIYSRIDNGTTVELFGYATLQVGGVYRVYEITLFSGNAMDNGAFRSNVAVFDLAMPLNQL